MNLGQRIGKLTQARPLVRSRHEELQRLTERIEHLETLVEGLQDAIHRDSVRHEERMADLERKLHPETLAKSLSDDARRRGL